jgi:hypothetical protein
VQDIFFRTEKNRVAGVVAAGVADDDVRLLGEDVNDFALAFIAPLGTNENCVCHKFSKSRAVVRNKNPRIFIRGKARGLCRKKLENCGGRVNSANFRQAGI